jgi:hypothetical protein
MGFLKERNAMYEAPTIIGTCINCVVPGSLSATLALIVIGAGIVWTAERRKLARVRIKKDRPKAVLNVD